MFDIKNEKWFIRVNSEQEAIAVQEWAFSQDCSWTGSKTRRTDFRSWETPCAIGWGHFGGNSLGQATASYWLKNKHKELKISLKLKVDTVIYPEVESAQQKQIKALEATIAQAAAQIQKLKEL